ncbi:MAG: sensor histidine kinase [Gemmatimonas sp.]
MDDTPDDRQLVRHELLASFPDAEVVEIADRASLEAALAGPAPQLVVTDLQLRWGTGREVFERARAEFPSCPVVMFTGSGDETTAVELMKAGLDDYVVKSPRQLPRLRASLRIVVEAARHRRALTEREAQLAAALERHRVIIRELHHRVKNNLQTVMSLLRLRAREIGGEAAEHLDEVAERLRAMASVQAQIYETDALDRVDFAAALCEIAATQVEAHGRGAVELVRAVTASLTLDVSRAMPLGLLCYEIIHNALRHAWPERGRGRLVVEVRRVYGTPEIRIVDDGIGYSPAEVESGLGSRISRALAQEARADLNMSAASGAGTCVSIRLRDKGDKG